MQPQFIFANIKNKMFWLFRKKKVGLVLGGGVARGIAHIGVLKILTQNKIPIDFIAATSSGSIVACAFASGMGLELIEQIALRINWTKFLRIAFFQPGLLEISAVEEFLKEYLGDKKFSDLQIPLHLTATDLKTGNLVVLKEGSIARAAAVSTAFPGFFAPAQVEGKFAADGGIAANLPVSVAKKMGADLTIAVDVIPSRPIKTLPKDPFQVFGRSLDLVLHKLSEEERKKADILIDPEIEEDIWHLDLHKAKRLIAAGEAAGHRAIGRIKRGLKSLFWP